MSSIFLKKPSYKKEYNPRNLELKLDKSNSNTQKSILTSNKGSNIISGTSSNASIINIKEFPSVNKQLLSSLINQRVAKIKKYESLVIKNKNLLTEIKEKKIEEIKNTSIPFSTEEKDSARLKYYNIIWKENENKLKKDNQRIREIREQKESEKAMFMEPQMYNLGRSFINKDKGAVIFGKRKDVEKEIFDVPFIKIKDDFDRIKPRLFSGSYSPRTIPQEERMRKIKMEEEFKKKVFLSNRKKFEKYLANKENNEKIMYIQDFINERKVKKENQSKMYNQIKKINDDYIKSFCLTLKSVYYIDITFLNLEQKKGFNFQKHIKKIKL